MDELSHWQHPKTNPRAKKTKLGYPTFYCPACRRTFWQLDFKDNVWVEVEPEGKQQHLIGSLNMEFATSPYF